MPDVINGLNWDVSAETVRNLLQTRADQCDTKAKVFAEQAEAQAELTQKLRQQGVVDEGPVAKHSGDQSENLRAKAAQYTERSKMYKFLVNHVVKDGVYRLDRNDLEFLGVVDSRHIY